MSEENNTSNCENEYHTQDTPKASLEGCITVLERSKDTLKETSQQASKWIEAANSRVQEAVDLIRKNFQAIREALDKKEEEMLKCLEKRAADLEATQELINDARDLFCEISAILEDEKALLSEWDSRKPEAGAEEAAAYVLAAREKAEHSEDIAKQLGAFEQCEVHVETEGFLRCMKRRLEEIDEAKEVQVKRILCTAPTGLAVERVCSVFAILRWDKGNGLTEYAVQKREEGREWDDEEEEDEEGGLLCVDLAKEGSRCVVHPLKPDTAYEFRVRGKGENGLETRWSDAVSARTERKVAAVGVYGAVYDLRENMNDEVMCATLLRNITSLAEGDGKQN